MVTIAIAVAIAIAIIVGCTSFGAANTENPADAASTDAAGTASDGGAEATSFCASLDAKPTFCDDFERSTLLGEWDGPSMSDGGLLAIEPATLTRAGRALHTTLPSIGSGVGQATLWKRLSPVNGIEWRFAMRIDALPSGDGFQLNVISVYPGGSKFVNAGLLVKPDGVVYFEYSEPSLNEYPLTAPIVAGRVSVIDINLTPTHATVKVDGAQAYDGASLFVAGQPVVNAGINYVHGTTGSLSVFIDDLAVYLK
jgi:hypothetical protein